jgi:RNase P/RNase MRP subunit p29
VSCVNKELEGVSGYVTGETLNTFTIAKMESDGKRQLRLIVIPKEICIFALLTPISSFVGSGDDGSRWLFHGEIRMRLTEPVMNSKQVPRNNRPRKRRPGSSRIIVMPNGQIADAIVCDSRNSAAAAVAGLGYPALPVKPERYSKSVKEMMKTMMM